MTGRSSTRSVVNRQTQIHGNIIQAVAAGTATKEQEELFKKNYRAIEEFRRDVFRTEAFHQSNEDLHEVLALRRMMGFLDFREPLLLIPSFVKERCRRPGDIYIKVPKENREKVPNSDLALIERVGIEGMDGVLSQKDKVHMACRYFENVAFRRAFWIRETEASGDGDVKEMSKFRQMISLFEFGEEYWLVFVPDCYHKTAVLGWNFSMLALSGISQQASHDEIIMAHTKLLEEDLSPEEVMARVANLRGKMMSPKLSMNNWTLERATESLALAEADSGGGRQPGATVALSPGASSSGAGRATKGGRQGQEAPLRIGPVGSQNRESADAGTRAGCITGQGRGIGQAGCATVTTSTRGGREGETRGGMARSQTRELAPAATRTSRTEGSSVAASVARTGDGPRAGQSQAGQARASSSQGGQNADAGTARGGGAKRGGKQGKKRQGGSGRTRR